MQVFVVIGFVASVLCLIGIPFVSGAGKGVELAVMACAFSVVPYVGFRFQQLREEAKERREFYQQVRGRMQELHDAVAKHAD